MNLDPSHAPSLSKPQDFLLRSSARCRPSADPIEGGFTGRTARPFGALRGGLTALACLVALPGVALSPAKGAAATASSGARTCSSITYLAPSGPRNNITYVLDKAYACGQFANGDWFVVPDQAGGAVVVTAITPDYSNLMNGWDTNPDIRGPYHQSWDHRLDHFREPPTLPYSAPAGTSIIKVVSMANCAATTCEQFGAVLTVLEAVPASPQTTFRPPANGAIKPLFSTDLLHPAALPSYPSTCCLSRINAAMALARSKGFRNNYSPDTVWGYYMIPADNVGYQRAWGGDMWLWDLEILGYLMLDDPPRAKLPVLIAYVQPIRSSSRSQTLIQHGQDFGAFLLGRADHPVPMAKRLPTQVDRDLVKRDPEWLRACFAAESRAPRRVARAARRQFRSPPRCARATCSQMRATSGTHATNPM